MTPGVTFGDVDYDIHGGGYVYGRRTDPRIAALVHGALGGARTVLNVGAGTGSYEPADRHVLAVEPSAAMRAARASHLAPAINAVAENLPFDDGSVDAAMAMVTVHQWSDPERGLRELRRVSRGPVVVLTFDGAALDRLWLVDYVPQLVVADRPRFPSIARIRAALAGVVTVAEVPVPADCVDGFNEAFYCRPERFLDPAVRACQSVWSFVDPAVAAEGLARLRSDLDSGAWDRRYGALRRQPTFVGALRLVLALPADAGTGKAKDGLGYQPE
ncbi:methyltransferase domain-containing protein [Frankia sp. R82]|uniref:class I SAM-dependent methyltransferase n=1 Tax=Frankia sp. R82 TaxID=2950553 RepID=UPI002043A29F|nr:methyltransferase domain-containing protein [Frankia sp. R82]MCM3884579.1 methyltransferase domain-containing protein [Frankia sp. R82]